MSLRLAMKQMRGAKVSEEEIKVVKKIEKSEKSSMFKCKFCGKRFNEEAGKREYHEITISTAKRLHQRVPRG